MKLCGCKDPRARLACWTVYRGSVCESVNPQTGGGTGRRPWNQAGPRSVGMSFMQRLAFHAVESAASEKEGERFAV